MYIVRMSDVNRVYINSMIVGVKIWCIDKW